MVVDKINQYDMASNHIKELISEIIDNTIQRDILSESGFDFSGEVAAIYYSNLRRNLQSDVAHTAMEHNQDLRDLEVIRLIKYENSY